MRKPCHGTQCFHACLTPPWRACRPRFPASDPTSPVQLPDDPAATQQQQQQQETKRRCGPAADCMRVARPRTRGRLPVPPRQVRGSSASALPSAADLCWRVPAQNLSGRFQIAGDACRRCMPPWGVGRCRWRESHSGPVDATSMAACECTARAPTSCGGCAAEDKSWATGCLAVPGRADRLFWVRLALGKGGGCGEWPGDGLDRRGSATAVADARHPDQTCRQWGWICLRRQRRREAKRQRLAAAVVVWSRRWCRTSGRGAARVRWSIKMCTSEQQLCVQEAQWVTAKAYVTIDVDLAWL